MNRTEYMKEYMKKRRSVNKNVNKSGENVNISGKSVNKSEGVNKDIPEFARVLPQERIDKILTILRERKRAGLFDDSQCRWARAVSYLEWERTGVDTPFVEKLVSQRKSLQAVCEAFQNSHHPEYGKITWLGSVNQADIAGFLDCTSPH